MNTERFGKAISCKNVLECQWQKQIMLQLNQMYNLFQFYYRNHNIKQQKYFNIIVMYTSDKKSINNLFKYL